MHFISFRKREEASCKQMLDYKKLGDERNL